MSCEFETLVEFEFALPRKRRGFSRRNSESPAAQEVHPAKPVDQSSKFGPVLLSKRGEFQSQSGPGPCVPNDGIRADLAFGHKKVEPGNRAGRTGLRRFNK